MYRAQDLGAGRKLLKPCSELNRTPVLVLLLSFECGTNAVPKGGMGQKTSDFLAIPLCAAHHRDNLDSYHTIFWARGSFCINMGLT